MKFRKITNWDALHVTLGIEDVCCILQCCDKTAANLIKDGKIKGVRMGNRFIIDRDSVREFVCGKVC